jgi:hypothetical protein
VKKAASFPGSKLEKNERTPTGEVRKIPNRHSVFSCDATSPEEPPAEGQSVSAAATMLAKLPHSNGRIGGKFKKRVTRWASAQACRDLSNRHLKSTRQSSRVISESNYDSERRSFHSRHIDDSDKRHRRLPGGGGGLSFEVVGSGTNHGGGQALVGLSATL